MKNEETKHIEQGSLLYPYNVGCAIARNTKGLEQAIHPKDVVTLITTHTARLEVHSIEEWPGLTRVYAIVLPHKEKCLALPLEDIIAIPRESEQGELGLTACAGQATDANSNSVTLTIKRPEHWYSPGYGLLFNATWVYAISWNRYMGFWVAYWDVGYAAWHYFATWHELHVEIFHLDYPQPFPHRSITNEDGLTLAYLDWHWTDDAEES